MPEESFAYKGWSPFLSSDVVIREFLPICISPLDVCLISELPAIFKPSEEISISSASLPIWIDPSEFLVIKASPSILIPSSRISTSLPSDPIWTLFCVSLNAVGLEKIC